MMSSALNVLVSGSPCIFAMIGLLTPAAALEEKKLSRETRKNIEIQIDEFAKKAGIQKKLRLFEFPYASEPVLCCGDPLFTGTIVINPDKFTPLKDPVQKKLLAQSVSRLKSHDPFTAPLLGGLMGLITMVMICILFPHLAVGLPYVMLSPAGIGGAVVGYTATTLFDNWRSRCARKNALILLKG